MSLNWLEYLEEHINNEIEGHQLDYADAWHEVMLMAQENVESFKHPEDYAEEV